MSVRIRTLVPMKPSAHAAREATRLLRVVTSSAPGTSKSDRARWDLEHLLMRLLHGGGIRAVERVIGDSRIPVPLTLMRQQGARVWSGRDDNAHAALRISITDGGLVKSASVTWMLVPPPPPPARTLVHRRQNDFYAQYMAAGRVAYADPPGRLSRSQKMILNVGDFEADVNNGGFSQFLFNKGRRRALATVRALKRIRAPKTAAMLTAALGHPEDDARLGELDDRFYAAPEDLAVKTMAWLSGGRASRRKPTRSAKRRPRR
jgi:hypothetical protein